jgi:hypothetical protein
MKERPNALDFMNVCKLLYPFEKQLIEIKKAKDRDELLEVVYSKQPHDVIGFDRNSEVFIKYDITNLSKKIFNIVKSLKKYTYENKTMREINDLSAIGSSIPFSQWTLEQVYIRLQTMYDNVIWGRDLVDELYVEYTVIQGDILDILNCFLIRT